MRCGARTSRSLSLNYFASASAAFLLILLTQYLSVIALAAVVPLLAVINLAMRSWTGRLEDAEQHVATVDRLYLSTIGALSTAIEAKDGVTSSHIHRVQHYAMGLAKALGGLDEQTHEGASRPRRCCTTPASSPCPSASSTSPAS